MPVEIEAKFRVADAEQFRRAIAAAGGQSQGVQLEVNTLLDAPDRRLRQAGCGLRVRLLKPWPAAGVSEEASSAADAGVLTFKGPRQPSGEDVKIRAEYETAVSDAAATLAILRQLGFEPVIVYEKRRATWVVDACNVTLDELPGLGWFVEIEGPTPDAVAAVRGRLGLAEVPGVRETYVELAARHGQACVDPRSGAEVRRLVF